MVEQDAELPIGKARSCCHRALDFLQAVHSWCTGTHYACECNTFILTKSKSFKQC